MIYCMGTAGVSITGFGACLYCSRFDVAAQRDFHERQKIV